MAIRRRRTRTRRRARRGGRRLKGVTAVGFRGAYPTLPAMRAFRGRRVGLRTGMKRTRARTMTRTTNKRRRVMDPGGYTQWNSSKFAKKLGRLTQRKLNLVSTTNLDLIWKRTGRLDGGGQIYLGSWSPDSTQAYRPIFLCDLTSGAQVAGRAAPCYILKRKFDVSFGSYQFEPVAGYEASGITLDSRWQTANWTGPTSAASCGGRAILKWSEIRADIWGTKEHPCEWTFTLCQLDDRVLPTGHDYTTYLNGNALDANATTWWDSFSQQLVFTPSDRKINDGVYANVVKVLDRRTFVMNPTSTTETDTDPHVRSIRLFYNMNRKLNFVWEDRTPVNAEIQVSEDPAQNPRFKPFLPADVDFYVAQKARVFMMVTCKCWRAPIDGYNNLTTSNTPSFNFAVYNRWISNSGN